MKDTAKGGLFAGGEGKHAFATLIEGVAGVDGEAFGAETSELLDGHPTLHSDEPTRIGDGAVLAVEGAYGVALWGGFGMSREVGIDDADALHAVGQQTHGYLTQTSGVPRAIGICTKMELLRHFVEIRESHSILFLRFEFVVIGWQS